MSRPFCIALAFLLMGCGTSPEFVDDPDVPRSGAQAASNDAKPSGELPKVEPPPCGMSTRAVQAQARRGRYGGVEGFDSRNCPPAGRDQ